MPHMRQTHVKRAILLCAALLAVWIGLTQAPAQAQADDGVGARLFAENCAVCHGADGQGRVGATLAKDWPSIRPDLTVKTIIENGVPGSPMIAWSQAKGGPFSAAEIDALVNYILSWQTGGAPQITPGPPATSRPPIQAVPEVEGDPNQGAVLFDENCAVCHGHNGEGRIGEPLAKDWSGARPDLLIQNTIQNGIPNSSMPAWGQAKGGPLSESEISNLTAFILSWQEGPSVIAQQPTPTPEAGPSWLSGWGGALLLIILLVAVIGGAIYFQMRK